MGRRQEVASPACLVHGDSHLGNLFVDGDGRPGLYDWIGCIGRWGHDVNYAIVGCLDVADGRRHAEAILDHYPERLASAGGPKLDRDRAWLSWRRQTIHGLLYMMCSPRQQPEAPIAQQTVRFAAAADDHDLLAILDAG
jgi:aminoglycoside phosphotransferase (APT) family kinase protein